MKRKKTTATLLIAIFILSITAIAIPIAPVSALDPTLVGSFSRTYQTTTTSTDFYLAIGLAAPVYFTPPWPPDAVPVLVGDPAIGWAPTYKLFHGMTPGAFLFEDIQFGSQSEGKTYIISSVSDDPDFDDFAAFLTNGIDDNIWEAWIWPIDGSGAGGIRCAGGLLGFLFESDVFSGTDIGTDYPGWTIQRVSLTFDDIYTVHSGDFDWLKMDYTVEIYAAPPPVIVEIDIKPGSDPNSINLDSKGVVPVVVLTTEDFDASAIEPETVLFAEASPVSWTTCDVDNDGDLDVLFHFKTQEIVLDSDSSEAVLTGSTIDGTPIEGTDFVNIVPKGKAKGK